MGTSWHRQDHPRTSHRPYNEKPFFTISAILAGKAELKAIIEEALELAGFTTYASLLFVDEVHRWNKAQQDALLPHVETGTVTLIGATTENPYFEVISAPNLAIRAFFNCEV